MGLAAVILALGLIASFSLPPTFLLGAVSAPQTTTLASAGRIDVTVLLRNSTGSITPMQGVRVAVAQVATFGLREVFTTGKDGNVSIAEKPGVYGVSIVDPRFTTTTSATVSSGGTTRVRVSVNRTSLYAYFVQAQDSTGEEKVGPWNQLVLEVASSNNFFATGLWALGGIAYTAPIHQTNATLPHFGAVVFLRPLSFVGGSFGESGSEVPASVVSQIPAAESVWLTLRPSGILLMTGADFLAVVTYAATSTVSRTNG